MSRSRLGNEGEGQVNVSSEVWVEAEWSVTDEESHVMSCTCRLGKHLADRAMGGGGGGGVGGGRGGGASGR